MSLIKKSDWPFLTNGSWLSDFFDNDRFFDSKWFKEQTLPAVNVTESEKGFQVDVAAPGLTKKDFNIAVKDRVLTISSEKKAEKEEKEKDFTRKEFSYTSFSRSFALPDNVNEEDVQAKYEDGVLKLSLSKKAVPLEKSKRKIEVQ